MVKTLGSTHSRGGSQPGTARGRSAGARARSPENQGVKVTLNGKNMTPLPLLFRPPTDVASLEEAPGHVDSEPATPSTPKPIQPLKKKEVAETPSEPATGRSVGRRGSALFGSPGDSGGSSPLARGGKGQQTPRTPGSPKSPLMRQASFSRGGSVVAIAEEAMGANNRSGAAQELPPGLSEADLQKPVNFTLTESPTVTLLHIPSCVMHSEDREVLDLKKRNAAYQELCDAKAGSDKYVPRSAQTLNPPTKHKSVSATPPAVSHVKLTAEGFAIADAFREQEQHEEAERALMARRASTLSGGKSTTSTSTGTGPSDDSPFALREQVASSVDAALKTPDCLLNPDDPLSGGGGPGSPNGSRQGTPSGYGNSRQGSRIHSKEHAMAAAAVVPYDTGSGGKEPATGGSLRSPRTANGGGGAFEPSSARSAGSGKGVGVGGTGAGGEGIVAAGGGAGEKASNEVEFTPAAVLALQRANRVLSSPELLQGLLVAERAVMQDQFMGAHLRYREIPRGNEAVMQPSGGFPKDSESIAMGAQASVASVDSSSVASPAAAATPDPTVAPGGDVAAGGLGAEGVPSGVGGEGANGKALPPALRKLFDFKCDLTRGRTVTTMAWNAANADVLAIAYGEVTPEALDALNGATYGGAGGVAANGGTGGGGMLQPPNPPSRGNNGVTSSAPPTVPPSRPGSQPNTGSGANGGLTLAQQLAVQQPPLPGAAAVVAAGAAGMGGGNQSVNSSLYGGPNGNHHGGGASGNPQGGLVLFWSLRNPLYPERAIHTASGVTALACSKLIPNLVAVGLRDGTVAIYNPKRDGADLQVPLLDTSQLPSKHMEPAWQLAWIDKGAERGEALVSVSSDGRVAEWNMKKGLSSSTLMVLKRTSAPNRAAQPGAAPSDPANSKSGGGAAAAGAGVGAISRHAPGLSFDFPNSDPNTYFAGTEDGAVHRCSTSYTEQSLATYSGHAGPVYRVKCAPFGPAFLSCSADWTVKLWDPGKAKGCVATFRASDLTDVVHDVCWSPTSSTVFALATGDGRIELWDLEKSTLDPQVSTTADDGSDAFDDNTLGDDGSVRSQGASGLHLPAQTALAFGPGGGPVLVVGDAWGRATVYEVQGIDLKQAGAPTHALQAARLSVAMASAH